MWSILHSKLLKLIDMYVPVQRSNYKPKPKWLNNTALKAIKRKHKAWNTYMATRHYSDFVTYTRYRNIATATVRSVKSTFETSLANNIKHITLLYFGNMLETTLGYDKMLISYFRMMAPLPILIMK